MTAFSTIKDFDRVTRSTHEQNGVIVLGWDSMGYCFAAMALNILLTVYMQLGLAQKLVVASVRTVVQLIILGLVLEPIFRLNQPYAVLPICFVLVLLAVRETFARPKHTYGWAMLLDTAIAMCLAVTASTAFGVFAVVRPTPWYDAQYVIPLVGMLLGNMVSSFTLTLDRCLKEFSDGRRSVELLLAAGATKWEATRPLLRDAMRTGMMPTLNSMQVIGLVSIPGMMTGQILSGTPPQQAARYQIFIMFLITVNVTLGLVISVFLCVHAVFDNHHRLLTQKLKKRKGKAMDMVSSLMLFCSNQIARIRRAVRRRRNVTVHTVSA